MTTADAIEYFERQKICLASINLPGLESCEKALEALRLMQEIEEMKPLVVQAKETAELDQMMREIKNHKPTIFISEPEIVRCKDCKHWHKYTGWCYHHSHFVTSDGEACHPWESADWKMLDENDFCSYGERRADYETN